MGAALILGAYLLLSVGKVTGRSPLYHWMNVIGAGGFVINTAWHGAMPSAAMNVIWVAIGAYALWRIFRLSGQGWNEPGRDDRVP